MSLLGEGDRLLGGGGFFFFSEFVPADGGRTAVPTVPGNHFCASMAVGGRSLFTLFGHFFSWYFFVLFCFDFLTRETRRDETPRKVPPLRPFCTLLHRSICVVVAPL